MRAAFEGYYSGRKGDFEMACRHKRLGPIPAGKSPKVYKQEYVSFLYRMKKD